MNFAGNAIHQIDESAQRPLRCCYRREAAIRLASGVAGGLIYSARR